MNKKVMNFAIKESITTNKAHLISSIYFIVM